MLTTLHLGANVQGFDNEHLGKVKYLVAEPQTDGITHFVISHTGREIVVEAGRIEGVSEDGRTVSLNLAGEQLAQLPDFVEREYVNTNVPFSGGADAPLPASGAAAMINPVGSGGVIYPMPNPQFSGGGLTTPSDPMVDPTLVGALNGPTGAPYEERMNVPEDSLIIRQGVRVEALDGKLGSVKDVNLDPATGRIASFVVAKGLFFSEDIVVPIELVSEADQDIVYLKVNRSEVTSHQTR